MLRLAGRTQLLSGAGFLEDEPDGSHQISDIGCKRFLICICRINKGLPPWLVGTAGKAETKLLMPVFRYCRQTARRIRSKIALAREIFSRLV